MKIKIHSLKIEKEDDRLCSVAKIIELMGESYYERHVKRSGIRLPDEFPVTVKSRSSYIRGWFSKPSKG